MFDDKNLLTINNFAFKAYLEDSDVSYETKDQQLPFAPVSFNNDSMMLRVLQKLKLSFNVFSENRTECINNYRNLLNLIESIKPSYRKVYSQFAPLSTNVKGYLSINFRGLPLSSSEVKIHLTNFSYVINKDMGYLDAPVGYKKEAYKRYAGPNDKMKLIPIAYKISLEGKILQKFEETAHTNGSIFAGSKQSSPSGVHSDPKKSQYDMMAMRNGFPKDHSLRETMIETLLSQQIDPNELTTSEVNTLTRLFKERNQGIDENNPEGDIENGRLPTADEINLALSEVSMMYGDMAIDAVESGEDPSATITSMREADRRKPGAVLSPIDIISEGETGSPILIGEETF